MKHKTILIALLSVAGFAAGCKKEETASQQLDKVQAESKEAAQDMKDYTYAQKGEFVKGMQDQLTAMGQDLDKLSARIESSSDAVKTEAKPKLQALREQATRLNQQLDDARNATESTWDSVKASSRKAYAAVADGFQHARAWASDKIAP